MKQFTCKQCVHAGEPHTICDHLVVECRCQPVSISGFPVVLVDSWCTPGMNDTMNAQPQTGKAEVDEPENQGGDNPDDYITRNNGDGTIITMHIPTIIMNLYDKVQQLEQELTIIKESR